MRPGAAPARLAWRRELEAAAVRIARARAALEGLPGAALADIGGMLDDLGARVITAPAGELAELRPLLLALLDDLSALHHELTAQRSSVAARLREARARRRAQSAYRRPDGV